ncbi:HEAT repeat domain-containing protein [Phormidium sp. LEGE 05292]|uniref:HEAT repeat domain-containing protein n=1 Tax=[Phormidium] sp. LEGE 05292 TaxID=767427 RepID=UPI00188237C2|nr:HEAT repeat domain-containing protein [Phormidium sp. LEGE 05292]MBE9228246.1 HEAT repeat domain-containing protein [Phormidium sp. LEGE 05292]
MDFLAKATIAAAQENWSLLNQCLQHLLQSKTLVPSNHQQILHWALEILTWGDFQDRWDVAKIFPGLGKQAIAPLISILQDEEADEELCWFAARILGEFNDSAVISALVELLKTSESEELTAMATTALANQGKNAIAALTELLNQEEWRLLSVRGLAHIRTKETITPLLSVVNESNVLVRTIAIEALGSFHDPLILPVLLAALKDVAASVRKEAVIALGVRSDLKDQLNLVKILKPLLWDFNLEVCQQTAIALGRLGTDEAAEALFSLWESKVTPLPLQLQAIRALSWVETPQAIAYLKQIFQQDFAVNAQQIDSQLLIWQEIITVLGQVQAANLIPMATQDLIELLNSSHPAIDLPEIRQNIATSLGLLADPQAVDSLQSLLSDRDAVVQLHAIAALKKFPCVTHEAIPSGIGQF